MEYVLFHERICKFISRNTNILLGMKNKHVLKNLNKYRNQIVKYYTTDCFIELKQQMLIECSLKEY